MAVNPTSNPNQAAIAKDMRKTRFDQQMNEGGRTAHASTSYLRTALPRQLNLEKRYGDAFSQSQVDNTNYRRMAEAEGVDENFGEYRDTLMRNSPEFARATAKYNEMIGGIGSSDIEDELQRQALEELQLGRQLTAEEKMEVSQASRAAWSDRGLATSTPAAVGEVMDRVAYGNQRLHDRRNFAQGIEAQVNLREGQDRQFGQQAMGTTTALLDPFSRLYPQGSQEGRLDLGNTLASSSIGNQALDRQMQYRLTREGFANSENLAELGFAHDAQQAKLNAGYSRENANLNYQAAQQGSKTQKYATAATVGASVATAGAALATTAAGTAAAGGAGIAVAALLAL